MFALSEEGGTSETTSSTLKYSNKVVLSVYLLYARNDVGPGTSTLSKTDLVPALPGKMQTNQFNVNFR